MFGCCIANREHPLPSGAGSGAEPPVAKAYSRNHPECNSGAGHALQPADHQSIESRASLTSAGLPQAPASLARNNTMDDAARLVGELQDKLTELDGKVTAYQRDMLTEFHKHMDECLKDYPDHISGEVSRAIAASISAGRYPALNCLSREAPDSPAIDRTVWGGRKSPPPILRHTSGIPKESPRDPHAREKEFQGLFTPTYLPLLEDSRALQSPPMSPPPISRGTALALSTDNVKKVAESKQAFLQNHEDRPSAIRRLTDQSTSSLESSSSDSKTRRSALRRSSSSVKGSPRRVRFEFEGEEVFPASSSPKAPSIAPVEESGAEPQPEAEAAVMTTENESTAYSGTSLLDAVGEQDSLPRPRKVSSTQALQALTRSPLEEGTTWREVNADAEEPAKMNGTTQPAKASNQPAKTESPTIQTNGTGYFARGPKPGLPLEESAIYDDEDESASDEEFLSIPIKRRSSSSTPSPSTPPPSTAAPRTRPPNAPAAVSQTTAPETNRNYSADDDGLNPLFDFDDEAGGPAASQSQKSQKYLPDPESSDDEDTTPPGRLRNEGLERPQQPTVASISTSAAATRIPPVSPSSVLFSHSVGSYMGRSVVMPPVKDAQLYDEIAGMDDVQLYVGSVKDISAAQAASMGTSYRASSLARGGVPRSFSERLALEEEMERRNSVRDREEEAF
ncbi:hypothetical protein F5144DRAFT_619630 [Chaetomium tenue]|uniref:Uncharacterized protein n=1 Tax=Chaetomium tenue TaxID=1854479 RepID=A0ACB7PBI7_9PEZI|nr:hypothetical protein F5144DRAFT_619630 [Chaetomium globosum]